MRSTNDLITLCASKKKIKPDMIRACLRPQHAYDAKGNLAATRPTEYD
jgi:hypothetical protein